MPKKAPSYRKRNGQALVTLTDSLTKRRRDYCLGEYDTSRSRERYHRTIAEWELTFSPNLAPFKTREFC